MAVHVRLSECSGRARVEALLGLAIATGLPAAAFGHTATDTALHFAGGALHPLTGIDHLLTALAVGALGALLGRAATWLVPVAFLLGMQSAWALSSAGAAIPQLELAILASVAGMGILLRLGARVPLAATLTAVAAFGILHGHAHASAASADAAASFGAGLLVATGGLHAAGAALTRRLRAHAARVQ